MWTLSLTFDIIKQSLNRMISFHQVHVEPSKTAESWSNSQRAGIPGVVHRSPWFRQEMNPCLMILSTRARMAWDGKKWIGFSNWQEGGRVSNNSIVQLLGDISPFCNVWDIGSEWGWCYNFLSSSSQVKSFYLRNNPVKSWLSQKSRAKLLVPFPHR